MLQNLFYQQAEKIITEGRNEYSHQELQKKISSSFKNEPIELQNRLTQEFFEYGPIHSILENEQVTEIIINGPDKIFYEEKGVFVKHNDHFYSENTFKNFVHRITEETRSKLDLVKPHVNASWKNFRVHILGEPIAAPICITLRRKSYNSWSFEKLIRNDWADEEAVLLLKEKINSKKNILIIGPTGCGKTTVLNSLLREISSLDRCVIIEDTDEIFSPNEASTKLLTREESHSNLNNYSLSELVKQSLRMRPNRLVVGEIRGKEAKDYLLALSTGHNGGICSMHANGPKQALTRLEMLIQLGAPQWHLNAVRQMIRLSLDCILTLEIQKGTRKLKNISRISTLEPTGFTLETLWNKR